MPELHPAEIYSSCSDLWAITAYFNPCHYRTRQTNYHIFAEWLHRSGIPLLTVECAVGGDAFELAAGPDTLQVRCSHVLWQKERLLNLAVAHLPPHVSKVAWLDNDILFTNPNWAVQASALLNEVSVVQPFERAIRLSRDTLVANGSEPAFESFASVWNRDRSLLGSGDYRRHGHTGFAWVARRDLLQKHGLYEAFLSGNGDHYIVHAMCGEFESRCVRHMLSRSNLDPVRRRAVDGTVLARLRASVPRSVKLRLANLPGMRRANRGFANHFLAWARPFGQDVQGRIGVVPGTVLHLWHGDASRQHGEGRRVLHRHHFDPATDLRIGSSGCLEWASEKPGLHRWAEEFFRLREEDGRN